MCKLIPRRTPDLAALALALAALPLLLTASGIARADGMYSPVVGTAVANTADQQALLVFGAQETRLVLRTGYRGDGQPFSWIVPTAMLLRREDVSTVDPLLFLTLDDYTAPQLLVYEIGCGTSLGCAAEDSGPERTIQGGVTVFDTFHVDGFEIHVLAAADPRDLSGWLRDHDYQVPGDADRVFSDYVRRGFSFVAVRIDPAGPAGSQGQGADAGVGTEDGGSEGGGQQGEEEDEARALVMRFPGTMSTFPLLISSLSTAQRVEVMIYTLGLGRYQTANRDFLTVDMELPATYQGEDFDAYYKERLEARLREAGGRAFAVEFAGPLPDLILDLLRKEGLLESDERDNRFITRLRGLLGPELMDQDIQLEEVPGPGFLDQHRVRVITGYQGYDSGLAAVLPLDFLLVLGLAWIARLRGARRRT